MYLTNRFSSSFEKLVQKRGLEYFTRGFIKIIRGDREVVRATVKGSYDYDVFLRIVGRNLLVSCTCPYYDNDLCKHIWATLLSAERKGYLMGTDHLPSQLVMADADSDE